MHLFRLKIAVKTYSNFNLYFVLFSLDCYKKCWILFDDCKEEKLFYFLLHFFQHHVKLSVTPDNISLPFVRKFVYL